MTTNATLCRNYIALISLDLFLEVSATLQGRYCQLFLVVGWKLIWPYLGEPNYPLLPYIGQITILKRTGALQILLPNS